MTEATYRDIRGRELAEGGWSPAQIDNKLKEEIVAGGPAKREAVITQREAVFQEDERNRRRLVADTKKRQAVVQDEDIQAFLPAAGISPDDFIEKMKVHGITKKKEAMDLMKDLVPVMEEDEFSALEEETKKTRGR